MTNFREVTKRVPNIDQLPVNADMAVKGSLLAIRRAALRARQVAEQTGTDLIVMRSGAVVRVPPSSKAAAD